MIKEELKLVQEWDKTFASLFNGECYLINSAFNRKLITIRGQRWHKEKEQGRE